MMTPRQSSALGLVAALLFGSDALAVDARAQLIATAGKLADTKRYSVTIAMSYDVVQKSGQKIEFSESRKLVLDRPNRFRVDTKQSDGDQADLLFDGKTLTLYSASENVFAQSNRPGDTDSAIRYAVGKLGMRLPLARLLVTTLPEELARMTTQVEFVERNTLGGTPTDHIAGRTNRIDFQFWIGDDGWPRRVVLDYRNEPGQPQFRADFIDWNLSPTVSDADFAFSPPDDAEKIPTMMPVTTTTATSEQTGSVQ